MNRVLISQSVQPDALRQSLNTLAGATNDLIDLNNGLYLSGLRVASDNIDWVNNVSATPAAQAGTGLTGGGLVDADFLFAIDPAIVCTLTDPQTLTQKTLTLPTIGDFTNATHTHTSAATGGALGLLRYLDPHDGTLGPPLARSATTFQPASGTAFFRYLGRATSAGVVKRITLRAETAGVGAQTAEVGLFRGTGPPGAASMTMTCIWANTTLDDLTAVGPTLRHGNTVDNATAHAFGDHLYSGFRCAMATTQPFFTAETGDWRLGRLLTTAGAAAFAPGNTYTGALLTDCDSPAPLMVATT